MEVTPPVLASKRRMFLSLLVHANESPFTSQIISWTRSERSELLTTACPDSTSQILIVWSALVLIKVLLAVGWYRRRVTFLACPSRVSMDSEISFPALPTPFSPVGSQSSGMDQILMVASSLAVASMVSSKGLHSMSRTAPEWPFKMGLVPSSNLPGRSCLPTTTGPPPPNMAHDQYFADALTYCWSPVEVDNRKPTWSCCGYDERENVVGWRPPGERYESNIVRLQIIAHKIHIHIGEYKYSANIIGTRLLTSCLGWSQKTWRYLELRILNMVSVEAIYFSDRKGTNGLNSQNKSLYPV